MYAVLVSLVIGLFVAMLFLQIYFRVRVMKVYKVLVQHRVQFGALEVFNKEKLKAIQLKYPKQSGDIQAFSDYLKYSIRMASVLIFLITVFGATLMYFR